MPKLRLQGNRHRAAALSIALGLLLLLPRATQAAPSPAATSPSHTLEVLQVEVAELRRLLEEERLHHEARVTALEEKLEILLATPAAPAANGVVAPRPAGWSAGPVREVASAGRARLLDLSLNALFAAGGSTARDQELAGLQGGGHDPTARGFTVQNVELSLAGAVDPHLRGDAHVIFQVDQEGESVVELEEVFFSTTSLPHGLQLKAGQYFTEFGRLNPQHPHQWQFVDQPVVNTRFLGGDGLRGPGVRLSWLTPAPWYSELLVGVQRASGEIATSFFGPADEPELMGHPLGGRDIRSVDDLLTSVRWLNSLQASDTTTVNLGLSAARGPNASGPDATTWIDGLDVYLRWMPVASDKGWPFLTWQLEAMRRRTELGAFIDRSGAGVPAEHLDDWGFTTQVVWGFKPRWTWGLRVDAADGEQGLVGDNRLDAFRDSRRRVSTALTWFPTEFSKFRVQYSWDRAEFLAGGDGHDDASSVWVQWEFNLGAHGAHQF